MRGYLYIHLSDYDKALTDINKGIELDPSNYDGYYKLGIIYLKQKNIDKAKAMFSKSFELNPNDYILAYNIAQGLFEAKEESEAIDYYTKSLSLHETEQAYCNRVSARQELGNLTTKDYNDLISDLDKALAINPRAIPCLTSKELIKFNYFKDYQGIVDDIRTYFKKYPEDENISDSLDYLIGLSLCHLYIKGDKMPDPKIANEAMKYLEESAKINSSNKNIYPNTSLIYQNLEQYSAAYREAVKAVTKLPIPEAKYLEPMYRYLANATYLLSINDKSLDYFKKAIELDPNNWYNYLYRADYYISKMQLDKALIDCQKGYSLMPSRAWSIVLMIEIYYLQKKYSKALKYCNILINRNNEKFRKYYGVLFAFMCYKKLHHLSRGQQFVKKYIHDPDIDSDGQTILKYLANEITQEKLGSIYNHCPKAAFKLKAAFMFQFLDSSVGETQARHAIEYILNNENIFDNQYEFARARAFEKHILVPVLYNKPGH